MLMLLPMAAIAQNGVGTWKIHPVFGSDIKNIVDAGNKVYYLASGNLYCYDKETEENSHYNKGNKLSDVTVTNIYYNATKKYLVVVYDNANIDIIENSGKVINMPDIKNAEINADKSINDVTFASGAAYVATDFGYVVINDTKFEVKESRMFGQKLVSVAQMGKWLLLSQGDKIYYGLADKHMEQLSDFKSVVSNDNGRFVPIDDTQFFLLTGWFAKYTLKENGDAMTFENQVIAQTTATNVQRTKTGFVANFAPRQSFYYTIDADGSNVVKHETEDAELMSSQEAQNSWWALSTKGIRRIEGDKASGYLRPNALTFENAFFSVYDNARKELWVSSTGTNYFISAQSNETGINALRGGQWVNVTPTPAIEGGGTYGPLFDPNDSTTYYLNSWWNGIYKVKSGKVVGNYNWTNSPMTHPLDYYCHNTIAIDKNGNLWAVQTGTTDSEHTIMVLPKAKLASASVTKADWATPKIQDVVGSKFASLIVTHDNLKVYADGNYKGFVSVWNDGGNLGSNIRSTAATSFLDQDDKSYSWLFVHALVEDQNGRVWLGSDNGVVSFDPRNAFDSNFRVNRIKVPRNDGTNLADYLLDGQTVNCIAVDGANRKWIGTDAAGLFLVSSDGSEILQQFNTSNSDLLSNKIYNVCCNPNSNSVYVVTAAGVMEYFSNSTPAEADYSNIYAYPNPVRPDYNGLITIRGLMENSLVKIADAAGNVVKQLKSNGGMATWDGCNENGDKVKSGVYAVLASQHENDNASGAVTKIVIIR